MDSYDEYEKLADSFQVELDKRQQLVNERKAQEKLLREERSRQLREERRNKRAAKSKAVTATPVPTPPRGSPQPFHPYKNISFQNVISLTDPRRGLSAVRTADSKSQLHGSISSNSQQPPHLIHSSSHPAERSISNSPILPLTPSPLLQSSDSSAAVSVADVCLPLSASSAFSSISLFAPLPHSGGQEHTTPRIRKKRKQAIPVHSSIVDRTPGITLRIQPDTTNDQHLQVEILRNVEDYRSTQTTGVKEVDSVVVLNEDEGMGRITQQVHAEHSNVDASESQKKNQAKQDLDKIIESIKSGRPGYAFYASPVAGESAAYQHLHMPLDEDSHGESTPQNTHVSKKSLSASETSASTIPSMDLHDVIAARAALPLSWNNFSTRDCQVNKVIGKHDRDFELLGEAVQEAIARQHAAHVLASSDESDSRKSNQSSVKTQSRRASELEKEREDFTSSSSVSTPQTASPTKKARSRTHSRKLSESVPPSMPETPTRTRVTGARGTRGSDSILVQGYDDIEKILKEKRQKKRAEKQRQESVSRMTSEPVTDGGHETDIDIEGHEEPETITMKSEDDVVLSLTHSYSPRELTPRSNSNMEEALNYKDEVSRPYSQPNSPPSPPHSRQTSPVRGERGSTYTNVVSESDTSSTPPTTPLFAPNATDSDHPSANTRKESNASIISASTPATTLPSGGIRARTRVRSSSDSIPPEGKNNFFDLALERIAAKRREQLAKKKAAAAAAAAAGTPTDDALNILPPPATPLVTDRDQDQDAREDSVKPSNLTEGTEKTSDGDKETLEQLLDDSEIVIELDSHALERGLHDQDSDKGVESSAANLPKSSKFLPGRVLRKTRAKMQDPLYAASQATTSSSGGATPVPTTTTAANAGSIEQSSHDAVEDIDLLDPDCTSCRLVLNNFDRLLWKQAREAGKVHLNRRTWSKTAILCIACRLQYQKHHLRCTQCFYVPVLTDDMMTSRSGLKAGGTCSRCKAGTWHRDSD
ncbi:hypothetical protein BGX21_008456 [Mortierella sp. AD011]|nr:hypothetical protein BGX21_008456 [Mortierella sp. AD011]